MTADNPRQQVSAAAIRRSFFDSGDELRDSQPRFSKSDLTPSARYILQRARQQLSRDGVSSSVEESDLISLVHDIEEDEGEALSDRERTVAVSMLTQSRLDFDLLTPLIEHEEVNDVIVSSYNDISFQIGRVNHQCDIRFPDHATYLSFIENLLKRVGKSCTTATPVVDAALSPHIRACVTHESFSPRGKGPTLTLRVSRHQSLSLGSLASSGLAPHEILEYLRALVQCGRCTMLIGGEVGTGKTTLVRALAQEIHEHEAILTIEDTEELALQRRFVRTLLTRESNTEGAGRISPAQAIHTGMRMAMNRILLGEIRHADTADAFIDVCASGHPGISTIHARSARDAISRLELFLARAQGHIGVDTIRRQIANAISSVVFLGIDQIARVRRIFEVVEVGTSADGIVQLSPIYRLRSLGNEPVWRRDAGVSLFKSSEVHLSYPGTDLALSRKEATPLAPENA